MDAAHRAARAFELGEGETAWPTVALFAACAAHGTDYHQRFLSYLHGVQDRDLTLGVAMTDAKGERTLRPLGCFYWGKVWTLAAWCERRNDFRSFRVDRVTYVRRLEDRFRDEPGRTLADLARLDREWSQGQGWM